MESLKICHVSLTFPPVLSGISTAIESVCKELAKREHEVEVLTRTIEKTRFVTANEKMHDDNQYNFLVKRFKCASLPILAQLEFSKKVGEYLATKEFDVIHLHYPLILPPKGNHRFYVTMHSLVKPWLQRSGHSLSIISNFKNLDWYTLSVLCTSRIISQFEKKCVSEAEKVICVSKATGKKVKELYGGRKTCFEVVYSGLDQNTFRVVNSGSIKKKNYVLYTGLFMSVKGIEDILKLAKILNDTDFVLVGTGPLYNKYTSMKNKLGLDNVSMPGRMSGYDLLKVYREAKIFIFPTYFDTFGMSVLDAMFSGLPVISTNVGGIPELITHEVEGILVSPGDIGAMVKWIQRLMNDGSLRERLAKAAKEKANKEFTIEKTVDKLLELYKNRSKVS